jgi:hypothetical protein
MRSSLLPFICLLSVSAPACTDLLYPDEGSAGAKNDSSGGLPNAAGSGGQGGSSGGQRDVPGGSKPSMGGSRATGGRSGSGGALGLGGGEVGGRFGVGGNGDGGSAGAPTEGGSAGESTCPDRDDFENQELTNACWSFDEVPDGAEDVFLFEPDQGLFSIVPEPRTKFTNGRGAPNIRRPIGGNFIATVALSVFGPGFGDINPGSAGAVGGGLALFMDDAPSDGVYAGYYFVKVVTANETPTPGEFAVSYTTGYTTSASEPSQSPKTTREVFSAPDAWRYSELRACRRGSQLQFLVRGSRDEPFQVMMPANVPLANYDLMSASFPNPNESGLGVAVLGELDTQAEAPRIQIEWFAVQQLTESELDSPSVCLRED